MLECVVCKQPYDEWAADDGVWAAVMGGWEAGMICFQDFQRRATDMGVRLVVGRWFCPTCDGQQKGGAEDGG